MNPTFSVIIPAYNAAATIVASVRSVLEQTEPPAEVIVVDDGSTDKTQALLHDAFGDAIRIISLERNSGPSAARNAGLAAASGTHIAFQDADDHWHRGKLASVAKILAAKPDIHFLYHPYTLRSIDFSMDEGLLRPERFPMWKLLLSNPIGTPCVVIRRDKALRFDERLRHMEDYELFLREAQKHGVWRIAAPFTQLGRPILAAGGQSSSRWRMRRGEIKAWLLFARRHRQYYFIVLPLILFALAKHLVKSFYPPRTNY